AGLVHDRDNRCLMAYRIELKREECFNCGICMDLCPVHALDMTSPERPGVEAGVASPGITPWMMEYPVQVGTCIGCSICVSECPVQALTLSTNDLAPMAANLTAAAPEPDVAWQPLSELTHESVRDDQVSPWTPLSAWPPPHRDGAWQVWRAWADKSQEPLLAPCQEACPAGTDAGRYIGLLAAGRFDEAFVVAAEVNPFASVCGYICTAPCETVCRRIQLDEPVAIRALKRAAAEHGELPPLEPPEVRRPERIAVVGAGPAGLSAAHFLARLGYGVTVFEAQPVAGGMMAIGIPEYRLPKAILREEIERIVALGVELRLETAMGRDFSLLDLEREGFAAVFLATGASKSRRLGVPGEELAGVVPATAFLRDVNLDSAPRLAGPAIVVGGGSTAMDAARSAWRGGASHVTVLYGRSRHEMRAQVEEIEAAEAEGVTIRTGVTVVELHGRDGRLTKVVCREQRATGKGPDGRMLYTTIEGSDFELEASALFTAIGEEPDPSILPSGSGIEISSWAGVVAHPRTLQTGRVGVFAGGDVVTGPRTVIDAVANGRKAAASIHGFLTQSATPEADLFRALRSSVAAGPHPRIALAPAERAYVPHVATSGDELAAPPGFDKATAQAEATRCLRCDALYTNTHFELAPAAEPVAGFAAAHVAAVSSVSPGGSR
ncbi:MAG: FAD-dependent oxidoreductase, partial [Chloroflexota bacterium]